MRRDWQAARRKLSTERGCRLRDPPRDRCAGPLQAAHVSGRRHDKPAVPGGVIVVHPEDVIPLCAKHHEAYDANRLDILPVLTLSEQLRAVQLLGGIEPARRRLTGQRYAEGPSDQRGPAGDAPTDRRASPAP